MLNKEFKKILNTTEKTTDECIMDSIPLNHGSGWLSRYVFLWNSAACIPVITLNAPDGTADVGMKLDIHEDKYHFMYPYRIDKKAFLIPYISTEEEFFQASVLVDLNDFSLEFFQGLNSMYTRVVSLIQKVNE